MMGIIYCYVAVSRNLILFRSTSPFCALKYSAAYVCYVGLETTVITMCHVFQC